MKYDEFNKTKSKGSKIYIVIAFCILILGGASWFALSQFSVENSTSPKSGNSEYNSNPSAYNSSETPQPEPIESTAQPVESQPYTEPVTPQKEEVVKSYAMPIQGEIIKDFSNEQLQYSATFGDMRIHLGVDIACKKGDPVGACSDGKILNIETNTSLGNTVDIDHGDGLVIKYASVDNLKFKVGDSVKTGDIIGTAATVTNECMDKSHLHIEAKKNGIPVSPLEEMKLN